MNEYLYQFRIQKLRPHPVIQVVGHNKSSRENFTRKINGSRGMLMLLPTKKDQSFSRFHWKYQGNSVER